MDIKILKEKLVNVKKSRLNAEAIFYQLTGAENLLEELIVEEEKNKQEVVK